MKLPKSVQVKESVKLFLNKYNYKIVLVTKHADLFRNKGYLQFADVDANILMPENIDDQLYCLGQFLCKLDQRDFSVRIEYPYVNIYLNDPSILELIAKENSSYIKEIYMPPASLQTFKPGVTITKKLDFDYKIYIGVRKNRNHKNFVEWAEQTKKIRLTNLSRVNLLRDYSRCSSYFYAKDALTLTMVKMFLGSDITRIEQLIKA